MDYNQLKTDIAEVIRTNGNEEITGEVLQYILLQMVSALGKNFQFAGVGTDQTVVGTPDENMAWILRSGRYQNFGTEFTVDENEFAVVMWNGSFSVAKVAVGRPVDDELTADGVNPVEGGVIEAEFAQLRAAGYLFVGLANTGSEPPAVRPERIFYICAEGGVYTNFNAIAVPQGISILKWNGSAWVLEVLWRVDNEATDNSQNLVKSGGVKAQLDGKVDKEVGKGLSDENYTISEKTKLNDLPTALELVHLLSLKQDNLTFDNTPTENSNNPVKSSGVYAADKALSDAIDAILILIPSAATALNQLADKNFVNSSIATDTATFRGTSETGLSEAQFLEWANSLTHDMNDYVFWQTIDEAGNTLFKRYKWNGTQWLYEYTLNNSSFTADQWAAITSGITTALVEKLVGLPTNTALQQALNSKQDALTFDNVPTENSNNPVKSGGVYSAVKAEEDARLNLSQTVSEIGGDVSQIEDVIPAGATAQNKLVANSSMEAYVASIIQNITASFTLATTDGHINLTLTQVNGRVATLTLASSDIASAQALTALTGRVTTAEGNITSLTGRVSTNEIDIANLQQLYNNLQQSKPVPVTALPETGQQQGVIYRLAGTTSYSDYMWNGSTWVLMATYNNAIDPRPKKASQNLVTSGGVFDNMGALDVSELNATENPHTLAQYVDLSAALDAITTDYRKGGMSIKFVQSSDNKYVQARLMSDGFTTDVTQWQVVEDTPQEKSKNIISSGGVFNNLLNIGIESADDIAPSMTNTGGITMDGTVSGNTGYRYSEPISVAAGSILAVKTKGATSLASIAVKLDSNYYPHTACMGNNPSYQFYIAKVDTNIVITCNAEELSSLVVKKFKNEVVNEIAKNYSSTILNTLSILYTDSRILKWGDIPAIEGAFGPTSFFSFNGAITSGTHKIIPVKPGDKITLFTTNARTYYAFLRSYSIPLLSHDTTIDYATGSSSTIVNSATVYTKVTAPSDAKYLVLCNTFNQYDWSPTYLTINDYDVFTGLVKQVTDNKKDIDSLKYNVLLNYDDIPIVSGNIDTGVINNRSSLPTLNGHRELPVKPGQLVKVYPSENRVAFAVVKQLNADGTFVYATGYNDNISRVYAHGPIEITIPYDCTMLLISEYYTSGSTTYHWYAEDILIDGCSIVKSQKDENIIWKNLFIENMLLGGAPITPVEFTYALPSGGDTLDDGSVCVGYYSGTTRYNEYDGDSHAGMTQFNMLNPILTQESYKALKDGDVIMWNQTDGHPDPEGESAIWRGEGTGSVGIIGNACAKFINDNTIRTLLEGGNCLCYVDFNRVAKTFEQVTGVYKFSGIYITIPKPAEGEQVVIPIYAGDTYNFRDVADPSVNYLTVVNKQFTLADETTTTLTFIGDIYFNVPDGVDVPADGILDKVSGTGEDSLSYSSESIYDAHIGHMILLKIGNSYFKSDFTASYVETIESAISAIDSNFQRYGNNASLTCDGNPVKCEGYYWISIAISNCACLFKSPDLKVFEFVRVIPAGYYSREVEFAPYGNYLYGIVRGWKNAFENGGYSQLFKYDTVNGTFSDFVELIGLCGERPAFAIVDNKIFTINRVGNTVYDGTIIQRGNKLFQVYDLDFNLLNTVPLNFRRGCNTIQFIVHAKSLYAFVPTDRRGFVVTQNAEGRNDLVWTYIDIRYLDK